MLPPADDAVRRRVRDDLTTTFLVEAGAGTGKTSVLVDRFVAGLLDGRGTTIDQVVAITFTEKAAGELRQRVRHELEALLHDPARGAEKFPRLDETDLARLREALADLEAAQISTIHSFAARLLRERPVEAGVDPAFRQLDQLGAELVFDQLWEEWLGAAPDEPESGRLLAELLEAEVSLTTLRTLAAARFRWRHELDPAPPAAPETPDLAPLIADVKVAAAEARRFVDVCSDPDDTLLEKAQAFAARLLELPGEGELHELGPALLAAAAQKAPTVASGRRDAWGGREGKERMVEHCRRCAERLDEAAGRYGAYVVALALGVAARFARFAAERQRALGLLDFDDLLGMARDLVLRRGPRHYFQQRFRYLLVDEFQDTDPLQAELVFLLAEREPATDEWRRAELQPGKLFLVGDPKQAIYRFRGADFDTYGAVEARLRESPDADVVSIQVNFRTVPTIIDWVNGAFAPLLVRDEARLQAPHTALLPHRARADDGPRVCALDLDPPVEGKLSRPELRRREARLIAGLLADLDALGLEVCPRKAGAETPRPALLGDVMILFPTFNGIGEYERALREADVPYRIEGGRTYFQRDEVRDAVLGLRAIDDAAGELSVYGALHSSLFGFSDDDLLAFRQAGGRFDYLADQSETGDDPLSVEVLAALELLCRLHEGRNERPLDETLDLLLRGTRLAETQAAFGDGPEQAVANLDRLGALTETYAAEPEATFHGLVRHLAESVTKAEMAESPVGEEGSFVRLTTVHKAKGLEFPVVVLANAMSERRGDSREGGADLLLQRATASLECSLRCEAGDGGGRFESAQWTSAKERDKAALDEEYKRLAYVACTRAADHLLVPVVALSQATSGTFLGHLRPSLVEDSPVPVARRRCEPRRRAALSDGGRLDAAEALRRRELWVAERERVFAAAVRPPAMTSPAALEPEWDQRAAAGVGGDGRAAIRRQALAVGSAVHRVMELVPLDDPQALVSGGELERLAASAADECACPELADRVAELARVAWASPPVRAAAASDRLYRELPVTIDDDGVLLDGVVDLLYRDGGEWVVVDFKTDAAADAAEARRRYELQGAAYALALRQVTGEPVSRVVFVLAAARPGAGEEGVVEVTVDDALLARTRERMRRVAAEPVASRPL